MSQKILYITSVGSQWGSEESLLNLLNHIDKNQYSPLVFTVNGFLQQKLKKHNIPYRIYKSQTLTKREIVKFCGLILRLAYFIRNNNFALVHANDVHSAQYSVLAARLARVPSIIHIRNIGLEDWLGWKNKLIFKFATKTIAISKETKTSLHNVGISPNKIELIPNAVDLDKFNEDVSGKPFREELGVSDTQILIGVVGRIAPHKGQDIFIESITDILNSFSNSKFVIVGEDTTRNDNFMNHLQELITQFKLEKKVYFSGFKPDIPQVMKALDILVVPSLNEAFGRVVIEAMAMKTPVIATIVGGIPDIIEDGINGFLISPNNPTTLSEAVVKLLSNNNLHDRISQHGKKTVEKDYSVSTHIKKIQTLYRSVIHMNNK
jgi:glycosyltransferase involved in cell wall biosynthesis